MACLLSVFTFSPSGWQEPMTVITLRCDWHHSWKSHFENRTAQQSDSQALFLALIGHQGGGKTVIRLVRLMRVRRMVFNEVISAPLLLPSLREASLRLPLLWLALLPIEPNAGKDLLGRMKCHASTPWPGVVVSSRKLWPILGAPWH
jgi:hypothetical protein